jgi:hypothetical protein
LVLFSIKRHLLTNNEIIQMSLKDIKSVVSSVREAATDAFDTTRNAAANVLKDGGEFIGTRGALAGEVALLVSGFVPYLLFAGKPTAVAEKIQELSGSASQFIRGEGAQFIGVNEVTIPTLLLDLRTDFNAVIYNPADVAADAAGCLELGESETVKRLYSLPQHNLELRSVYAFAVFAVQDAKTKAGLELETPRLKINPASPDAFPSL